MSTAIPEIITTRIINAPRELVWQAWTDPARIPQWWGPTGFSTTIHKMDFRTGGEWLFTMHGPDGTDYPNHKTFLEITSPSRLVMAHNGPPKHTMSVTFEPAGDAPHGDRTKVTILHVFHSLADYELATITHSATEGAQQHLARLAEFLETT
jgi:uncharacterized protein YndB with AHSA1/START domain